MSCRHWVAYSGRHHAHPVEGAAALEVNGLAVGYGGGELALQVDRIVVAAGSRTALVGPNGSGKSTLLKAVAGLLAPSAGDIRIYGRPVGACHHRVSYLAQRGEIDWRFPINVRRLVMTGRYVHLGWLRHPDATDHQVVEQVLAKLRIEHLAERQIGELSGGQQQRALLARALAQESDLLLLDEPLNAVDKDTRHVLTTLLEDLHQVGKTIIVATHDHGKLDEQYDQIVQLNEGRRVDFVADVEGHGDHAGHHHSHPH